jgi:hypothetical protein
MLDYRNNGLPISREGVRAHARQRLIRSFIILASVDLFDVGV